MLPVTREQWPVHTARPDVHDSLTCLGGMVSSATVLIHFLASSFPISVLSDWISMSIAQGFKEASLVVGLGAIHVEPGFL